MHESADWSLSLMDEAGELGDSFGRAKIADVLASGADRCGCPLLDQRCL